MRSSTLISFLVAHSIVSANSAGVLRDAAKKGKTAEIQLLLQAGVSPDAADKKGRTALIEAAAAGHTGVVKALIQAGAAPNYQDGEGFTSLRAAADGGHVETVRVLLDSGADVNFEHYEGLSTLMTAAARGHTEVARLLLARGAKLEARSNRGYDALSYSSWDRHHVLTRFNAWKQGLPRHPDTIQLLLAAGAIPSSALSFIDPEYLTKAPASIAILPVQDLRATDEKRRTPKLPAQLSAALAKAIKGRNYEIRFLQEIPTTLGAELVTGSNWTRVIPTLCSDLGANAILHVEMMASASRSYIITDVSAIAIQSSLTSCQSGQLLWKDYGVFGEHRGFIVARFVSGSRLLAESISMQIPRRPKR